MNLQPKSVARDLDGQWSQVRGMLRAEFGATAFDTWLAPLALGGLEGERILLSVPTRFLRDWVAAHYADRIRVLWRHVNPGINGVALSVAPMPAGMPAPARAMS
ncbi:MAG TPA: DnaA N-terminal domain-containing protein, partial [Geminicoccaceae bacterium]|nr:DnaA N-terminal domain-containing protein [Geminicoccaceae bacterium]